MSQDHSSQPTSIFSWPPSPTLLRTHLLTRSILLLTDTIGLSLLFAVGTGTNEYASDTNASAIVAASFLSASLLITPFIMLWNRKLLKRVTKTSTKGGYQQLDNDDKETPRSRFGVEFLKLFTFLEGFGALAFFAVYPPLMASASGNDWYWSANRTYWMTYSYGSVSILISILLHSLLFTTQALQLRFASRLRTPKRMICPHCNHTMTHLSSTASSTASCDFDTPRQTSTEQQAPVDADMLGESLVDSRVSVSMNAGQETGTTLKTPRVSENVVRGCETVANETGEGEGDALIKKDG